MRLVDLLVFLSYLASLVLIGVIFFRRTRSATSFTVGDQKIPAWVVSLSLFATYVSSISYLALPGSAYKGNWNPFVFSLSLPIAAVMAVKYFVPLYRNLNSPSAYSFLEDRFGRWARIYASSMYLLTQVMRVGTIVFLMALVPSALFDWSIPVVIIATSLVVMVYSTLGGIQAVIWTDAVQAVLLTVGAVVCLVLIVLRVPDGFEGVVATAVSQEKFSLGSFSLALSAPTFWVVLIYGLFINLQNFGADQNYTQRYLSARSMKDAQWSAFWGAVLYIPVSAIFLLIGTSLWSLYGTGAYSVLPYFDPAKSADLVFPWFIANELPAGMTGLLIASIFAAGMSTMSTSYNSSATIFLTDYFMRSGDIPEKKKMVVLYCSTAIVGVAGIVIGIAMISTKSALDTWWKFASIFSGGVLGLFLIGIFTRLKSPVAAMIAALAGLIVIVWMTIADFNEISAFHPYLTIVFGTTTIFILGLGIGWFITKGNPE